MSLKTSPFIMNMYYLIILFINALLETAHIPEANRSTHVGMSNSHGCCSCRIEEWLLNGQVASAPLEFPIGNCMIVLIN